jgi:malic enzyme
VIEKRAYFPFYMHRTGHWLGMDVHDCGSYVEPGEVGQVSERKDPLSGETILRQAALEYHEFPTPGKVAIAATKQLINQHDLALAYSPGVAAPCEEIVKDPNAAFRYTSRGNLVAVITNGTAVLGLGDIGPLAAKPVMEGKGVLFKKFAGIDVFDIEIAEKDNLDKLVDIIAALEPTFGGINLEDIKAPDCFYVERKLRERMKIPVFHDDQHGTAITVGAAILNGLKVVGKDIKKVKLVTSGAGAAALACLGLLLKLGLPRENIFVTDLAGVVYEGPQGADGRGQDPVRAEHQGPHADRGDRRTPTCSWACRPAACSSRRWSRRWRPTR